ncbi:sensor histidine kinase [Dyadobacter psychrotolerans]|uniref:Signal transduction histidine kinase internal region domain-containing protein n=1 Tax=Dyadobacter psychrotolerans TaxID=2541721 RepID=A0A4V2Z2P4_9BACT|nr:histidine kinase [Dyadobacter psychrotolerans]TDE09558.1 hypothetical protein E0F88_30180 [Dyadobacter psychrotolerans]
MDRNDGYFGNINKFLFYKSVPERIRKHLVFWMIFLLFHFTWFIPLYIKGKLTQQVILLYILNYLRYIPMYYLTIYIYQLLSSWLRGVMLFFASFAGLLITIHFFTYLMYLALHLKFGISSVVEPYKYYGELYLLPIHHFKPVDFIVFLYDFQETQLLILPIGIKMVKFGLRQKEKEKEGLQHELKALRSQLSPHFVFNLINSAYRHVLPVSKKAASYLGRIAAVLRLTLYNNDTEFVGLSHEWQSLNEYVDLESKREGDRLHQRIHLEGEIQDFQLVPNMLLLTLVENAFKHGVYSNGYPCWLSVRMTVKEQNLRFIISNSKPSTFETDKTDIVSGIGLANVKRRVELHFAGNYSMDISETIHNYTVDLTIPFITN